MLLETRNFLFLISLITLTLAAESENIVNPSAPLTTAPPSAHLISNIPTGNPPSSAITSILNNVGTATNTPSLITGPLPPSATATEFSVGAQSSSAITEASSVPTGYSISGPIVPTGPVGLQSLTTTAEATSILMGGASAKASETKTGRAARMKIVTRIFGVAILGTMMMVTA